MRKSTECNHWTACSTWLLNYLVWQHHHHQIVQKILQFRWLGEPAYVYIFPILRKELCGSLFSIFVLHYLSGVHFGGGGGAWGRPLAPWSLADRHRALPSCWTPTSWAALVAQLVEHSPTLQSLVGMNPTQGNSSSKERSSPGCSWLLCLALPFYLAT